MEILGDTTQKYHRPSSSAQRKATQDRGKPIIIITHPDGEFTPFHFDTHPHRKLRRSKNLPHEYPGLHPKRSKASEDVEGRLHRHRLDLTEVRLKELEQNEDTCVTAYGAIVLFWADNDAVLAYVNGADPRVVTQAPVQSRL